MDMGAIIFVAGDQNQVGPDNIFLDENTGWYEKARVLRKYPTIAMGRAILASPIISRLVLVNGSDEAAVNVLKKTLMPQWSSYIRQATYAGIDHGWLSCEVRRYNQPIDGIYHVDFKPLRHEFTDVLANAKGFVAGARNYSHNRMHVEAVTVKGNNFAHVALDDEYKGPYGNARLKNTEAPYTAYLELEDSAARYTKRVAGSHWILTYPVGDTPKQKSDGTIEYVSNQSVAMELLTNLKSSGSVAIPVAKGEIKDMIEGSLAGDSQGWSLSLLSEKGAQDIYLERQRFLDALMMRALAIPERVALEGHFGTKAESSEHADIALQGIEQTSDNLLEWINGPTGIVASVLRLNNFKWYPGIAYIQGMPLSDESKRFTREILRTLLNGQTSLFRALDLAELGRRVEIPINEEIFQGLLKEEETRANSL